jgi:N-acetyl-gamma-glutamyl-phosphate/LysW-gamma-L-alpha-aminoadipyl-6-phosphate reductase
MKVAIVGGSGYIGGELLRLLLQHPEAELAQITSTRSAGRAVHTVHPNLRGQTDLTFVHDEELTACDALFLALPHGVAMQTIGRWTELAPLVIDLSADFRLRRPEDYQTFYGAAHPEPGWLARFTPGIPEIERERLREARLIAVPGCMANAAMLALYPLAAAGLLTSEVIVDARTGSSGSGADPDPASHHAERSGVMRVFKPTGHRHTAEIGQICGVPVQMTATGVEAVRGVQVVCHVTLAEPTTEQQIWRLYRQQYGAEPFIRLVKQRSGVHRLPEPKILSGTNYCDIGFALADDGRHLVMIAALDNLVKGGAGNAVQCFNIARGWDERAGLSFAGLHPI